MELDRDICVATQSHVQAQLRGYWKLRWGIHERWYGDGQELHFGPIIYDWIYRQINLADVE